jgi:hypothetical protein
MTKKKNKTPPTATAALTTPPSPSSPASPTPPLVSTTPPHRRVMVLISEADLLLMKAAFADKQTASVTVHPPVTRPLNDDQREKRKAYRQRPEVREKNLAYRKARAKRIRDAKVVDGSNAAN